MMPASRFCPLLSAITQNVQAETVHNCLRLLGSAFSLPKERMKSERYEGR